MISRYLTPLLLSLLFMLCFAIAKAQNPPLIEYVPDDSYVGFNQGKGWAIGGQFGYDFPAGALSQNYRVTPTYGIGLYKKLDDFTLNINVNHQAYPVKSNSRGLVDNRFIVLGLYAGGAYDKLITPFFKVYGGLNMGVWLKRYEDIYAYDDECGCEINNTNFYFAPKVGFTYLTNSRIGIGVEAKYNVYVTGYDYVTDTNGGKLFNSVAATLILTYHF
ncbi:hypothetical protein LT679_09800 [Mucilaginibacter roseus]|uniref:Outer membrane protein beta-barrel domain-containing protein n=1 Tax=Mucilaginibacter roseus TaxID=1528868 RepID=A0ABS8U1A5_9SPHI|nr:hypothetical protein [Mucilaginibacter roseus]MCD8740893.1 hypothetical protein [Mucilaginibacter roseus]